MTWDKLRASLDDVSYPGDASRQRLAKKFYDDLVRTVRDNPSLSQSPQQFVIICGLVQRMRSENVPIRPITLCYLGMTASKFGQYRTSWKAWLDILSGNYILSDSSNPLYLHAITVDIALCTVYAQEITGKSSTQ